MQTVQVHPSVACLHHCCRCCCRVCVGVPASTAAATLTATYNDLESVKALFEANKGEIAGVILEPVVGNSGFIVPKKEFLQVCGCLLTEQEGQLGMFGLKSCALIRAHSGHACDGSGLLCQRLVGVGSAAANKQSGAAVGGGGHDTASQQPHDQRGFALTANMD